MRTITFGSTIHIPPGKLEVWWDGNTVFLDILTVEDALGLRLEMTQEDAEKLAQSLPKKPDAVSPVALPRKSRKQAED